MIWEDLLRVTRDDMGKAGEDFRRGWGWQEMSRGINQAFISAVKSTTGNHHLQPSVLEVLKSSSSFLLLLIIA